MPEGAALGSVAANRLRKEGLAIGLADLDPDAVLGCRLVAKFVDGRDHRLVQDRPRGLENLGVMGYALLVPSSPP